jgi:glycogen debranching enzyme
MLYANAFWYKAFRMAASVGEMLGDTESSHRYSSTARSIRQAINSRFGSASGYAGWLNSEHDQHVHVNHNSVLPVEYGIATERDTERVLRALFDPSSMTAWGPLHMDSAHALPGSGLVWAFQRWNLVHALFESGRTDQALETMLKWIDQESAPEIAYGAPEAFTPDGHVTSLGYSWTAGRAVRAVIFGLYGLELCPKGLALHPHLPSGWKRMSLDKLEVRGTLFDIEVVCGGNPGMSIDGQTVEGNAVPAKYFDAGHHRIRIEVR